MLHAEHCRAAAFAHAFRDSCASVPVGVQHSCTTQRFFTPAVRHPCSTKDRPHCRCPHPNRATLGGARSLRQSVWRIRMLFAQSTFRIICVVVLHGSDIIACIAGGRSIMAQSMCRCIAWFRHYCMHCRRTQHHGAVEAGATQHAGCHSGTGARDKGLHFSTDHVCCSQDLHPAHETGSAHLAAHDPSGTAS